jgi:2',3'-cyclic-nucleotide 2'-phosphodiesterase / 3'-nucleotidase
MNTTATDQVQPKTADVPGIRAKLRILSTTDLHMNLMSYDYFTDRPAPQIGLVRTASLIRAFRAQSPNCLLVDNGDLLQGNPLSDDLARRFSDGERVENPMIMAMNALHYDAGTLGNHEFNYGLAYLDDAIGQAGFPIVSANIRRIAQADRAARAELCPPFAVLDRTVLTEDGQHVPIRIGVIGFAPPQIMQWDKHHVAGQIDVDDIVEAARAQVPALIAAGAEIVIALCHSGIDPLRRSYKMENAAVPLAEVAGIDALVTGHAHQVFPGPALPHLAGVDPVLGQIHGKPVVMAGCSGSHLGVIDLVIEHRNGRWQPTSHSVHVEPIARLGKNNKVFPRVPADAELTTIARGSHRQLLRAIRRPIGATKVHLHSYFSLIGPDAGLQVVADAQRFKAREVLAGTPYAGLPLLSAVAPFKAGGRGGPKAYLDIPAGGLVRRHAAELYLYPNGFCVLALTGAAILDWLERSASMFLQVREGTEDQPLIDPDFPAYHFDLLDGLRYVIDPTLPRRTDSAGMIIDPDATRISDVALLGRPLDPAETILVATNSYRAGGGGGYAAAMTSALAYQSTVSTSEIVLEHLERRSPVSPDVQPTWRFRARPGTGAWFDTSPEAAAHAGAVPGLGAPMPQPSGFCRYTLRF